MKQCTWIRLAKEDIKVKKQAFNPYLPSWEYIPDGEPYVFGDRVYVYGSHDYFNGYVFCMGDYVCWSAPVDDLGNWRYEGVIYPKTAVLQPIRLRRLASMMKQAAFPQEREQILCFSMMIWIL